MLQTGHPTRWRDRLMCAEDTILRQGFGAIRAVKTCLKGIKSFWLLFFFFVRFYIFIWQRPSMSRGRGGQREKQTFRCAGRGARSQDSEVTA